MRRSGWPNSENTDYLNGNGQYTNSIEYRSLDDTAPPIANQQLVIGEHLKILLTDRNILTRAGYAIVTNVLTGAVQVYQQDGTYNVYSQTDFSIRLGTYAYEIGDPVWYNVHIKGNIKQGTLTDINYKLGTEIIESFTLTDDSTGIEYTKPKTDVLLRRDLPDSKTTYQSYYNI